MHSLKVIFICENNLYSVYSGLRFRQPKSRKIYRFQKVLGSHLLEQMEMIFDIQQKLY